MISGMQEKSGLDSIFLTLSIMVQIKTIHRMDGFVDDTKLEDGSLIKEEGNKIPSLGI